MATCSKRRQDATASEQILMFGPMRTLAVVRMQQSILCVEGVRRRILNEAVRLRSLRFSPKEEADRTLAAPRFQRKHSVSECTRTSDLLFSPDSTLSASNHTNATFSS
ncbi:hypothetical protein GWI33_013671 [Rhynchophorus ferrugineus]|uniref:Uncharacterized protein n=1 Tax=Rhynchophorus ferrugineus TaxID=354439 RepID=A0A834IGK6_RHYFE|nr:hypothetical protein GWI33_013671 [Rhynchophorus ferrugineus]